jgi:hypothetical protein
MCRLADALGILKTLGCEGADLLLASGGYHVNACPLRSRSAQLKGWSPIDTGCVQRPALRFAPVLSFAWRQVSVRGIMLTVERVRTRREPLGGRKEVRSRVREDKYIGGPPDRIDEDLRYVREQVLPQISQQDGFKGMAALADRQTGKTLGITFWESEEALRASEEAADRLRGDSADAMGDTIAGVERYEVGLLEMSN